MDWVLTILLVGLGASVWTLRRRLLHVENIVLRLQDSVTNLRYPSEPREGDGAAAPIDIEPFVD